jgi:hypothetical protein
MNAADFLKARQTPEFLRLIAIIGNRIRTLEDWLPWERLVRLYSWEGVLATAEAADPGERWPERVETDLRDKVRQRHAKKLDEARAMEWAERLARCRQIKAREA